MKLLTVNILGHCGHVCTYVCRYTGYGSVHYHTSLTERWQLGMKSRLTRSEEVHVGSPHKSAPCAPPCMCCLTLCTHPRKSSSLRVKEYRKKGSRSSVRRNVSSCMWEMGHMQLQIHAWLYYSCNPHNTCTNSLFPIQHYQIQLNPSFSFILPSTHRQV